MLAVAHGALLAGNLANRIFFLGASLIEFKIEIAVVVIFMMCVILGPMLFLRRAWRRSDAKAPANMVSWLNAMSARSIQNGCEIKPR